MRCTFVRAMGKECCPSKHHFAKVVTAVEGRPSKVTWKCDHCGNHVISGVFKAAYARIHLAAKKSNGLCSNLCTATDDHANGRREQFRKLIVELAQRKKDKARKRKQQQNRFDQRDVDAAAVSAQKKKKSSQPKLKEFLRLNDADAANHAVAQWVIAHDISPNALKGPYWQNMNKKLAKVSPCYKPMYPRKVFSEMLPKLKEMVKRKLQQHLAHRPSIGRTLTGDGATKQVPLINFLVYVPGKGVELVDVTDCSEHMSEGGTKDSM